jgi:hypothetical protein
MKTLWCLTFYLYVDINISKPPLLPLFGMQRNHVNTYTNVKMVKQMPVLLSSGGMQKQTYTKSMTDREAERGRGGEGKRG